MFFSSEASLPLTLILEHLVFWAPCSSGWEVSKTTEWKKNIVMGRWVVYVQQPKQVKADLKNVKCFLSLKNIPHNIDVFKVSETQANPALRQ